MLGAFEALSWLVRHTWEKRPHRPSVGSSECKQSAPSPPAGRCPGGQLGKRVYSSNICYSQTSQQLKVPITSRRKKRKKLKLIFYI